MTTPLSEVAAYDWLLEGYRRSLGRFRDIAYEDVPPVESFIPLFEALNWAATIALRLGVGQKPDLLRALEYARNAVHHDWLQALLLTPRAFGEGGFGEGYFGGSIWRWKPSEQLLPDQADRDREPLYCYPDTSRAGAHSAWRRR